MYSAKTFLMLKKFNLNKKINKYRKKHKTVIPFVQSNLSKLKGSRSFRGDWTKGFTVNIYFDFSQKEFLWRTEIRSMHMLIIPYNTDFSSYFFLCYKHSAIYIAIWHKRLGSTLRESIKCYLIERKRIDYSKRTYFLA